MSPRPCCGLAGWARRWFRFGRRTLVLIPIVIVALGGLAFAATQTFDSDHGHPFEINQYRYGTCPVGVVM